MSWMSFFFSFRGRFNRGKYWLFVLIYLISLIALVSVGGSILFAGGTQGGLAGLAAGGILFVVLLFLFILVALIASIAVSVKRLHDRNKSGLWLLLFFLVPGLLNGIAEVLKPSPLEYSMIGLVLVLLSAGVAIWGFLELAVLRGTIGDNKYGPDPVAKPGETAAAFD